MKILVCGGRDYQDAKAVSMALDPYLADDLLIIQGSAKGADTLAHDWAEAHHVECKSVQADWKKYPKSAGYIRNAEMLKLKPDLVIAFPGDKGTAHMVRIARTAGVRVIAFG